MDKEKEIQEMARVVCLISNCVDNFGCDNCEYTTEHCRKQCVFARNAEEVYNAGYRKADEVRKETAELTEKTTALDIIELIHSMDGWNSYGDIEKAIAERYGVDE